MKINPVNKAQPNFHAKVRNNAFMKEYIRDTFFSEKVFLSNALFDLEKDNKGDILEINGDSKTNEYIIENLNKKTITRFPARGEGMYDPKDGESPIITDIPLTDYLLKVADPNSTEHTNVFASNVGHGKKAKAENPVNPEDQRIFDLLV